MENLKVYADLIEKDLQDKIIDQSRFTDTYTLFKRKCLKYRLKKPHWINYTDRSFSWVNGLYALGLLSTGNKEAIRLLISYYDRLTAIKLLGFPLFEVPDQIIHAEVMLTLYSVHGKKRYLPLIQEAADLLRLLAEEYDGLIVYWPPDKSILIDSLGMISDFCYQYDSVFPGNNLSSVAKYQIDYTEQFCIDPQSGFPYHSYAYEQHSSEGSSTWGRGIGWYLLGLTAYARRFHTKNERLEQVLDRLLLHQDADGFLYDNISQPTHIDTSTTCMAAVSLARCIEEGLIEEKGLYKYYEPFSRAIRALCASVNERGEVLNCSGECKAAGNYSGDFGNYFSQGYTLMLLNMIHRNKRLQDIIKDTY